VLDARDPMGSRALAVEGVIASNPNKKLVLILNKVNIFTHTHKLHQHTHTHTFFGYTPHFKTGVMPTHSCMVWFRCDKWNINF
jgi:ribosome biogenesis GTPase A